MSTDLTVDQVNLSDSGFWGRSFDERDAAFRLLREQRPVAFFGEPPWPFLPPGRGYWAVTRLKDVVEASGDPATFSSAQGSVLPDLPPGPPFSYLRSMIDMDNPSTPTCAASWPGRSARARSAAWLIGPWRSRTRSSTA